MLEELMKTENMIAAASAVVAGLALGLTIWQGSSTRTHNRLSVRPHLIVETSSDDYEYKVSLTNNGLGPALIKQFYVLNDGKIVFEDETPKIRPLINKLFENILFECKATELSNNYTMPAKEYVNIMNIQFTGDDKPAPDTIKAKLNSVDLIIEYESFYKEKFKLDTTQHTRTFY